MGLDVVADVGVGRHLSQLCKLLVPPDDELLHAFISFSPNRREVEDLVEHLRAIDG